MDDLVQTAQKTCTPIPIRPVDGILLPDATVDVDEAVVGRRLDPGQTSRLPRSLPMGQWRVRWEAELGRGARPKSIQFACERILVQCWNFWALYNTAGALIAQGQMGPCDLLVDPEFERFFIQRYQAGLFSACALKDGAEQFSTVLEFAGRFHRTYMTRLPGNRLAVAGYHRDLDPHHSGPELSGIEVWNFKDNATNGVKLLLGSEREGFLVHSALGLLVARVPGGFALVVKDGIYFVDETLELNGWLAGTFTPRLLSADETGRLYLVVVDTGGQALWILTREGERLFAHPYPVETVGQIILPPIVGYDHRVYLLTETMARCLAPDGGLEWECDIGGYLGGATTTADGHLLVTAGAMVSTFVRIQDGDGEETVQRQLVAEVPGHTLGTAPILAPNSTLLVASDTALICLEPVTPIHQPH